MRLPKTFSISTVLMIATMATTGCDAPYDDELIDTDGDVVYDRANGAEQWTHDFENASIELVDNTWFEAELSDNGREFPLSTEEGGKGIVPRLKYNVARRGSTSLRAFKESGTNGVKHRSEAFLVSPDTWFPGEKRYVGFSVQIPEWNGSYDDWTVLIQAQVGWTNPAFAVILENADDDDALEFFAVHRWGKGDADGSPGEKKIPLGTYEKGQWHDFVLELNFDHSSGGLAKVYYKDGGSWNLKSTHTGKLGNRWNDDRQNDVEVKYGIYMGKDDANAHAHFFDQVKFSSSFNGAKP